MAPGGSGKPRLSSARAADSAAAAAANAAWLEDCVVRLLCVLALDRFGDFVSDQVLCRGFRQQPLRSTQLLLTYHEGVNAC